MAEIDALLTEMVNAGASDLHMVPGLPPMIRLKGDLVPTKRKQLSHKVNEQLFFEMMTAEQQEEIANHFGIGHGLRNRGVGAVQVQLLLSVEGDLRGIPTDSCRHTRLSTNSGCRRESRISCMIRKGLVLVTGPTGSGKSTTLAAIIDHINSNSEQHIITIEDPLEFVHQKQEISNHSTRNRGSRQELRGRSQSRIHEKTLTSSWLVK